MIKELLAYQTKEKEKLKLIESVERGKVKRDLDEAKRQLENVKSAVLSLDLDAQNASSNAETVRKNLDELLARSEEILKQAETIDPTAEDELNSLINYADGVASKIKGYESQLIEITKRINDRAAQFEDAKTKIVRATKAIQNLEPEYEKAKTSIDADVKKIDTELTELGKKVDAKLLEKYKRKRSGDKSGAVTDIAVPLTQNRCGGCHFELPAFQTHKVATDEYISCEECSRIIYKA